MPPIVKINLIISSLLFLSCEFIVLSDEIPPATPQREKVWSEIKRLLKENYALYNENQINHDSLINTLTPNISKQPIKQTFKTLLDKIKDPEISISSPSFAYHTPPKFKTYLSNPNTQHKVDAKKRSALDWGKIIDYPIAYLNIKNLDQKDQSMAKVLDTLEILSPYLIIDLRSTTGKNWENSKWLASHLVDYSGVYMYWKYRSSQTPKESMWIPIDLQTKKKRGFQKIAILQSRQTNFVSETLIFALKVMKTVTTVGDTTAGNLAFTEITALPSGYFVKYPSAILASFEKEIFHTIGIPPDHYAPPTQKGDFILEKAIELLR